MRWPWFSVIFLSMFQNLLEKPGEKECIQEHALAMVQCNISLCVSESVREAWREVYPGTCVGHGSV